MDWEKQLQNEARKISVLDILSAYIRDLAAFNVLSKSNAIRHINVFWDLSPCDIRCFFVVVGLPVETVHTAFMMNSFLPANSKKRYIWLFTFYLYVIFTDIPIAFLSGWNIV